MLNTLTIEELRGCCKDTIESLEYWLSRLIDEELSNSYGKDYFNYVDGSGNNLIKREMRERANQLKDQHPERYARLIDATLLDDKIHILCKQDLYEKHFKSALNGAFIFGNDEARHYMEQIIPVRNKLYHNNSMSVREAEKVICYSHDIIDSIKLFYEGKNKSNEYNVPLIIKIEDSYGNIFNSSQIFRSSLNSGFCKTDTVLRPGDILSIEVFVDESFSKDTYDIKWYFPSIRESTCTIDKNKLIVTLEDMHVRDSFSITCEVISKKSWHKCGKYDDSVFVNYKILPPL